MKKNSISHKILIVDHDTNTVNSLKDMFAKNNGATVLSARTADVGVELAWRNKPDLVIVSKDLVDLSGWDVLGILKKNDPTRHIPFIMLDEIRSTEDEIKALNLGADDYIPKPLDIPLFIARIKAILRRYLSRENRTTDKDDILKSGRIMINMSTHEVYVEEKKIELTPKEFALLYLFIKKQGRVLNRVFLSGTIWEREYFETSHTIDKHIANLRKKLGKQGKRIETLHTIGYKFTGTERN